MSSSLARFISKNTRDVITSRLRLREWDYRLPGPYFITMCTGGRLSLFGSVTDAVMDLSPAGEMVLDIWGSIPERYPNVVLNGFVVMPNHVHGIITLETDEQGDLLPDAPSLSDVIRWFKIQSTTKYGDGVREQGWLRYENRLWQPGFMERVIRSRRELVRLQDYIDANPALWEDDTFHPDARSPIS